MPSKASECSRYRPPTFYAALLSLAGGALFGLILAYYGWRLSEEALNWIMSTVAQALLALAALAGVLAVFKMQTLYASARAYKAANWGAYVDQLRLSKEHLYGLSEVAQHVRRHVDALQEEHQKAVKKKDEATAAHFAREINEWREQLHHLTEFAEEEAAIRKYTTLVVGSCLLAGGIALFFLFLARDWALSSWTPLLVGMLLGFCGTCFLWVLSLVKLFLPIRKI